MRFRWTLGVACAVLMAAMVVARAEDKKEDGEKKPRAAKLTAPWSKLSGLSEEQKQQIREIHGKANDEVKTIDKLANDYAGKVKIGKVNTDFSRDVPMRYDIRNIPTVILFKGGQVVHKFVGLRAEKEFKELLDAQG